MIDMSDKHLKEALGLVIPVNIFAVDHDDEKIEIRLDDDHLFEWAFKQGQPNSEGEWEDIVFPQFAKLEAKIVQAVRSVYSGHVTITAGGVVLQEIL
jgi:hypothetical protein